jgi:hypothetical protein
MATEIFLQPELEELVIDADKKSEWEEKIMSLGLEGQLNLTRNSENNSASPYTFMNKHMTNVFKILCPCKAAVEKYNKTQIPIDVLSHVALCKQEGYFQKLEIWYDNTSPDPILVGYVTDTYSSSIVHLIARWGDEIVPFEQLVDKAVRRFTLAYKNYAQCVIAEAKVALESADARVRQFISGTKELHSIKVDASLDIVSTDYSFESFSDLPF